MGKFREQEGSSGLEEPEVSFEQNIMHGFWLRFAVIQAEGTFAEETPERLVSSKNYPYISPTIGFIKLSWDLEKFYEDS